MAIIVAVCGLAVLPPVMAQPPESPQEQTLFLVSDGIPRLPFGGAVEAVSVIGSDAGEVVLDKPYSAVAATERTQHLSDGNRITRRSEGRVYRDSQGRVRRELRAGTLGPWQARGGEGTFVTINDPVSEKSYVLDPSAKTARELPSFDMAVGGVGPDAFYRQTRAESQLETDGERPTRRFGVARNGDAPAGVADDSGPRAVIRGRPPRSAPIAGGADHNGAFFMFRSAADDPSATVEDLGEQVLQGVRARGTRRAQTIPAGEIGNERPIEIVSETWHSLELGVDVMRSIRNPLSGDASYELVDIVRSEPPADLFTVPSDYEILEAEQGRRGFRLRLDETGQ
jgi:hypothetical protein